MPCALIVDLIEHDERPLFRRLEERPWMADANRGALEKMGPAKEAILESVLMIWRLKAVQEEGAGDMEWQHHLTAWLVRDDWLLRRKWELTLESLRSGIGTCVGLPGLLRFELSLIS